MMRQDTDCIVALLFIFLLNEIFSAYPEVSHKRLRPSAVAPTPLYNFKNPFCPMSREGSP